MIPLIPPLTRYSTSPGTGEFTRSVRSGHRYFRSSVSDSAYDRETWLRRLALPAPHPLEDGTIPIGDFYRSPETLAPDAVGQLVPKHGNSLMVQLVLNAMKLQQCRPGFFEARDAIIQADQVLTGGENFCDLWLAFAEKGLGVDAKVQGRTPWGGGIRKDVRNFFLHDIRSHVC